MKSWKKGVAGLQLCILNKFTIRHQKQITGNPVLYAGTSSSTFVFI
jgi:hypothetical protein